jgi:hypothetical protein
MTKRPAAPPSALFRALAVAIAALTIGAPEALAAGHVVHRPKLVVALVVDQFRADYLLRFENRFLPAKTKTGAVGGFEYLMTQGAYYPMAEYGILQCMTCPGHATILTGSYPYQSGIPLNGWYDSAHDHYEYCAADESFPLVGVKPREHSGLAPTHLIATTVGDELKNAGLPSKVVAVALKDRAAIMLGGHRADLTFWMDSHERSWVSSTFYLPGGKLPAWMEELNREIAPKPGQKIRWEAIGPGNGLSASDYKATRDTAHIGKELPHEIDASNKAALALPYGMELTEQAAERAFDEMKLGRGPGPDVLAISFSSHDYVGHAFGPNSREMEEMTVHEDQLISKLLNHLRKTVPGGLKDVVITLTGDHGAPPDPGWAKAHHIDAGMIDEKAVDQELEKLLSDRFGEPPTGEKWIAYDHDFDLFVSRKTLAARKAQLPEVLAVIQQHLAAQPGVAHVTTLTDYEAGRRLPGLDGEQEAHTYFPGRSGDVIVVPKPYWMVDGGDAVTHLTGYSYDRMVPLAIVGPGIRPAVHPEHARIIDLAPTLSYLLDILPPSLSEGRVLVEALAPSSTKGAPAPRGHEEAPR